MAAPKRAPRAAIRRFYERATLGRLSPGDPSRVKVDGGMILDLVSAARMKAARRLQSVENTLKERHGSAGLELTWAVLVACLSVEKMARTFGAKSVRETRNWGWLFVRCLDCLVVAFGLANTTARPLPVRTNGGGGIRDTTDAGMHAGTHELGDPKLRQGRVNGRSRD